ncbi:hypothetical protein GCM10010515_65930 [Streptomyces fructofermentans]|uniref:Gram-positive cocci surface proteins LPxTG domain-containing protein n=1 Tax=Streptomyces fructofermentans TaxID=152141 RepID=A0A918NRQ5_9ACTN|nr:hypothetical protein GCM10010515_65930 [Streptomyces fructofermentans]
MSLAVTAAAALTPVLATAPAQALAAPAPDQRPGRPTCADPGNRKFPVRTRIHGGPASYEAGGGFRTWYLDLTNTTDSTCRSVYPVVVLVDDERALKPEQPRLEFYVGDRPRPVVFERTDQDENVGVLGASAEGGDGDDDAEDEFPGFSVGPGETLTVRLRMSVTSDAVANDVVAKAAVVQRNEDDGEWIGQSGDYRFRIVQDDTHDGHDTSRGSDQDEDREEAGEEAEDGGDGRETQDPGGRKEPREPREPREPGESPAGATGGRDGQDPSATAPGGLPLAEQLAGTGSRMPSALAATAGALLLLGAGAAVLRLVRRRR